MKAPASGRITFIEDAEFHITKPYTTTLIKVREVTTQDESLWSAVLKMREAANKIGLQCSNTGLYGQLNISPGKCTCANCAFKKATAEFDRALKESNGK